MSHYVVYVITDEEPDVDALHMILDPYDETSNLDASEMDGDTEHFYNPNAKWDWYEVGGRWKGDLLLRDGTTVDVAKATDVAWLIALSKKITQQREIWDKGYELTKGLPKAKLWSEINSEYEDVKEAREVYWSQPRVAALKDAKFFFGIDDLLKDLQTNEREAACIRDARNRMTPYAILNEDGWHEPGQMGWFGVSMADDEEEIKFAEWSWNYLTDPKLDKWITVVDCHI